MEMKSPSTVSVRRNPPRKARATPSSAIPLRKPLSTTSTIPSFPLQDILSVELPQNPNSTTEIAKSDPLPTPVLENLKVYLRIRPLTIQKNNAAAKSTAESKNAWPKIPKAKSSSRSVVKRNTEICVQMNDDSRSVTVSTPQSLQETKRVKSEVYEGFSRVFSSEASQSDVFEEMVKPLVDDFLKGKSGMLAAMGPSGSGKTHTVFGCAREPGMVPLALRRIFSENESSGSQVLRDRVYYLSMLEISSERGKGERMIDLLHDGGDIFMHQSVVKGLQEAVVCDAQQSESLIARGMLKRATASTNSNNQSSRSQCIINIRSASMNGDEEVDGESSTMLTIVDLAGAEKEKRTGNQGIRLLESNFINNTSMVIGLCLRSLLEHQRNRNKPLQKHYQNSLLTRYMKDYLEGKKKMMLILTVKPGGEDYSDTSFVLRQASPFTKIKFKTIEEPVNLTCNKRPNHALPRAEQLKRMKFSDSESSVTDEGNIGKGSHLIRKGIAEKVVRDGRNLKIANIGDENLTEKLVQSDISVVSEIRNKSPLNGDFARNKADKEREYQIMLGFSKALWTALKQYKKNLEVLKSESFHLIDSLTNEKSRGLDLENELTSEKKRVCDLEKELKELKTQCACRKASTVVSPVSIHDASPNLSRHQMAESLEVRNASVPHDLCSGGVEEHLRQDLKALSESVGDAQDIKDVTNTCIMDVCFRSQELSVSTSDYQDSNCIKDIDTVDSEVTGQSTSACLYLNHNCEQDAVKIVGEGKTLESENEPVSNGSSCPTFIECASVNDSPDYEDLKDAKRMLTQLQDGTTDSVDCEVTGQSTSACLYLSHDCEQDAVKIVGNENNLESENEPVSNSSSCPTSIECANVNDSPAFEDLKDAKKPLTQLQDGATVSDTSLDLYTRSRDESLGTIDDQDFNCFQNMDTVGCEVTSQSTSVCPSSSHNCEQGVLEIVETEKSRTSENGSSCPSSLQSDSVSNSPDHEDIKDAKRKPTQFQDGATGNEDLIDSVVDHSDTVLNSSISPRKDNIYCHVEEEEPSKQDEKVTELLNEGGNVKVLSEIVPKLSSSCNIQPTSKPKRRLLPASSVLLKDISSVDIKDENDKQKGARGAKIVPVDDKKRTQGSLSLLHLLKTKLSQ